MGSREEAVPSQVSKNSTKGKEPQLHRRKLSGKPCIRSRTLEISASQPINGRINGRKNGHLYRPDGNPPTPGSECGCVLAPSHALQLAALLWEPLRGSSGIRTGNMFCAQRSVQRLLSERFRTTRPLSCAEACVDSSEYLFYELSAISLECSIGRVDGTHRSR
jgi:hypothetical protein